MAEVRPLNAVHYNLGAVGALADVIAPPYDVIDADERKALLARSPFNVVEIDLPEAPGGGDRYEHAAETLEAWTMQGILDGDREPALWALEQDYTGPDGATRMRRGILARVRVTDYGPGTIRPHERTQPGPKQDRLRLTEATRHNLSPIFSLHAGDAWRHLEPALDDPWAEATDDDGTANRVWRVADPAIHDAVGAELADAELLIADGHHRYETARTYADEIRGDGPHRYTLMCLVSLEDPGLTVFPTHRLLHGLDSRAAGRARRRTRASCSRPRRCRSAPSTPRARTASASSATSTPGSSADCGCGSSDPDALAQALGDRPDAYRELDAVILETLVLRERARDDRGRHRREARNRLRQESRRGDVGASRAEPPTPRSCFARRRSSRSARSPRPARRCLRSRPTSPRSCPRASCSTR